MKKLLIILAMCLGPVLCLAGDTVMASTNGTLLWPTNFFTQNGVGTTSGIASVTARVSTLEGYTNGYASLTQYSTVSGRVTTIEGDYVTGTYAAAVSNVAAVAATSTYATATSNTLYGVTTHLMPYTNGTANVASNIVVVGTNTAGYFVGNGAGLTGLSASTTNAVTSIIVGASNVTSAVTFVGTRVSIPSYNNVVFTNVEYVTGTIAPIATTYEYVWFMPRQEAFRITDVYGLTDQYTVNFSVVNAASNAAWRAGITTNLFNVQAPATGYSWTTFATNYVAANTKWGLKIEDCDTRTTQFLYGMRIVY